MADTKTERKTQSGKLHTFALSLSLSWTLSLSLRHTFFCLCPHYNSCVWWCFNYQAKFYLIFQPPTCVSFFTNCGFRYFWETEDANICKDCRFIWFFSLLFDCVTASATSTSDIIWLHLCFFVKKLTNFYKRRQHQQQRRRRQPRLSSSDDDVIWKVDNVTKTATSNTSTATSRRTKVTRVTMIENRK